MTPSKEEFRERILRLQKERKAKKKMLRRDIKTYYCEKHWRQLPKKSSNLYYKIRRKWWDS